MAQQAAVKRGKVLVVDDEHHNLELVARAFRADFDVLTADSGQEGLEILRKAEGVTLVISDQRMPGMTGAQFLTEARTIAPASVRVLMTAYADHDAVVDAVNFGKIWSYVRKPVNAADLHALGEASSEVYRLAAENRALMIQLENKNRELEQQKALLAMSLDERSKQLLTANKQLQELAARDGLTGLYNHRYFHERALQEVSRAKRYESQVGLIFMDLDHFKHYNDRHGHPRGDELLKELAKILSVQTREEDIKVAVRDSDLIARYGGEEFVILMPETPKAGAMVAAECLRKAIESHPFFGREDQPGGKVTVSLGVAAFPDDAGTKDELVATADTALYSAKRAGRNCVKPA